jgi:hypothetical protein
VVGTRYPLALLFLARGRYRNENVQRWTAVIDFLTMYPAARHRVVRGAGRD